MVLKVINPDPLQQFRYHFGYSTSEAMVAGTLVRISGDETVSAVKAGGGAVVLASTGADRPVGICLHNRANRTTNSLETNDLVDVWLFGSFSAVIEHAAPGGGWTAGSWVTLDSGHKALVIKGAAENAQAKLLI